MQFILITKLIRRVHDVHAAVLLGVAALVVVVGGILFAWAEGDSVGTGLYWAVTTASTVGYGDVTPHNAAGRVIAVCVMLTAIPIVGAVFALLAGSAVLSHLRRLLGLDPTLPSTPYTVVYGAHAVVGHVIGELARSGDPVVLVAADKPARLPDGVQYLAGDPTDEAVLAASEPARANRAFIACTDDADTLVVAVALRTSAPGLRVYALSESPRVASAMRDLGVTETLSSTELVGHTVAKSLETPGAGSVVLQLMGSPSYTLRERVVEADLASRPLSEARALAGALVLGISRDGEVDLGIGDDPTLSAGDRLIELVTLQEG